MSEFYKKHFDNNPQNLIFWLRKCVSDLEYGYAIAGPVEGFRAALDYIEKSIKT